MINGIILSICIPTYNRAGRLKKCLEMLLGEIKLADIQKHIEIVVINNASTDETSIILSDFINENPSLNVVCKTNKNNLGVDFNCHIAIHTGRGEFCWLFCDDDRLERGSLKIIFDSCLKNSSVAFAYVDYQVESDNYKHASRCAVRGIQIIKGESFFEVTRLASSFASSCIFNRKILDFEKYKNYVGTKWYHLYVARDCINVNNVLIIGLPLITQNAPQLKDSRAEKRRTDDGGVEFYMSAHLNSCEFVNSLKHTIYCNTRKKWQSLKNIVMRENAYQIINYKLASGTYSTSEIFFIAKAMCSMFPFNAKLWIFELPLLLMPNRFFVRLYLALRYANKIKKSVTTRLGI
jgi:glycosyltransferase involved in cell wall biosynthesis